MTTMNMIAVVPALSRVTAASVIMSVGFMPIHLFGFGSGVLFVDVGIVVVGGVSVVSAVFGAGQRVSAFAFDSCAHMYSRLTSLMVMDILTLPVCQRIRLSSIRVMWGLPSAVPYVST